MPKPVYITDVIAANPAPVPATADQPPRPTRRWTGPAEYVYVIGPMAGCHRIGRSKNPDKRLKGLCLMPGDPSVIGRVRTSNAVWLEKYLHTAYSHKRDAGEWFRLDNDDIQTILSIGEAHSLDELPESITSLCYRKPLVTTPTFKKRRGGRKKRGWSPPCPVDAKERKWWASDDEYEIAERKAAKEGLCVETYIRKILILG